MSPPGPDGLIDEASAFTFDDQKGTASFAGPLKILRFGPYSRLGLVDIQVDSARYDFNTMLLMDVPVLAAVTTDLPPRLCRPISTIRTATPRKTMRWVEYQTGCTGRAEGGR